MIEKSLVEKVYKTLLNEPTIEKGYDFYSCLGDTEDLHEWNLKVQKLKWIFAQRSQAKAKQETNTHILHLLLKKKVISRFLLYLKKLQITKKNTLKCGSNIYKELNLLANKNIPRNDKPLITNRHWELIVKEITEIYPNIYFFINDTCPNISEQEWQYCCLAMLEFDTNSEAKLLNINTASVRTKRLRLRQKLNLTLGPKETLSRHIADKLIPWNGLVYIERHNTLIFKHRLYTPPNGAFAFWIECLYIFAVGT